jgi:hypothetical protein
MSAWAGWEAELLNALGFKVTQNDIDFLNLWHIDTSNLGKDNPIDATEAWPGSTVVNDFGIRDYPTRSAGIHATAKQLHQPQYAAILAALRSGNPYTVRDVTKVTNELKAWGSVTFAGSYNSTAQSGPVKPITAPRAHKGWADMRRSINHRWPHALHASDRQIRAALRSLHRAHRVT